MVFLAALVLTYHVSGTGTEIQCFFPQHRYLKYIETMMYQVSYAMPSTEIAFSATRYPVVGRGVCCYANFGTHAIPSTDLGYGAMSVRY